MAEEVLNALCKVANLRVASRVAAFQFGGKHEETQEIGRKLQVQTVLEGSVRKSGDQLRITAQLINTSDGFNMWSRQHDRAVIIALARARRQASLSARVFSNRLSSLDDRGERFVCSQRDARMYPAEDRRL